MARSDRYFRAGFADEHKPGSAIHDKKKKADAKATPEPPASSGTSKKKFLPAAPVNPAIERLTKPKDPSPLLPAPPPPPRAYGRKKVDPNFIPELPFATKPKKKKEALEKPKKIKRDSPAEIEMEIRKFHWGALLLGWFWAFPNRVWTGALCFVPLLGFVIPFVLGFHGRRWAWENNDWRNLAHFRRVQKIWTVLGVVIFFGGTALFAIYVAPPAYRMGMQYYEQAKAAVATPHMDEALGRREHLGKEIPFDGGRAVVALGDGVVACAAKQGALPATSRAVPDKWLGTRYISLRSEWDDPTFKCAGFRVDMPQAYRYQWVRVTAKRGVALAQTDFDERGRPTSEIVVPVECSAPGNCRVAGAQRRAH